jgi:1-phosphatidylinositol phosphodiesterase
MRDHRLRLLAAALILFITLIPFSLSTRQADAHESGAYWHETTHAGWQPDWMSNVPGSLKLSQLSIPGTHDTMGDEWTLTDAGVTQTMPLKTQLESGIRMIDIRPGIATVGSFNIYHDKVDLSDDFGLDVMDVIVEFLTAHPGETVLMRITHQGDSESLINTFDAFEATLITYEVRYRDFIWQPPAGTLGANPTLDEVRGKIVILYDFTSNNPHGIWYESVRFDTQDEYALYGIADLYQKWIYVKTQLVDAANCPAPCDKIYINYLSGATATETDSGEKIDVPLVVAPYFVASGHSDPSTDAPRLSTGLTTPGWEDTFPDFPRVACSPACTIAYEGTNILAQSWLQAQPVAHAGIIIADFPGELLITTIISRNPRNTPPTANAGTGYEGVAGVEVKLSARDSHDDDGDTLEYRWDFDDNGTWDTEWSTNPEISYTWPREYNGKVVMQVRDEWVEVSASAPVHVAAAVNAAPIAMAGGPYSGVTNTTIQFNASQSSDPEGLSINYRWDFNNDGVWDTNWLDTSATSYRYTKPYSGKVKLEVRDKGGLTSQATANVKVTVPLSGAAGGGNPLSLPILGVLVAFLAIIGAVFWFRQRSRA